jgi:hypothetical protein
MSTLNNRSDDAIAIVGIACKLPQEASTVEGFLTDEAHILHGQKIDSEPATIIQTMRE